MTPNVRKSDSFPVAKCFGSAQQELKEAINSWTGKGRGNNVFQCEERGIDTLSEGAFFQFLLLKKKSFWKGLANSTMYRMKLNKSGKNKCRMELLLGDLSRQTVQVGQTGSVGKALP